MALKYVLCLGLAVGVRGMQRHASNSEAQDVDLTESPGSPCCSKKDPNQNAKHGCFFLKKDSCTVNHPHCKWTCKVDSIVDQATLAMATKENSEAEVQTNSEAQDVDLKSKSPGSPCCSKKDPNQNAMHGCYFLKKDSCTVNHPHCEWTCKVDSIVDEQALVQVQRHASTCPSEKNPKLLYNHIAKTGGTAVKELLQAALPQDTWKVEENVEEARLSPQKKEKSFVIGLVRRPCDYLVSWYYQLKSHCDTKADETGHLNCNNNGAKSQLAASIKDFVNDTEASAPHRMSAALGERYGTEDNVHCMMRTHNLKADFVDCMGKYQACGGTINNETSLDELADKALRKAAGIAHEAGRSVGNHPACPQLFDKELEATVLSSEQAVVDKYNLETCCSADKHQ